MTTSHKTSEQLQSELAELKRNTSHYNKINEDDVAVRVSSHLLMRHAQLHWLEELAHEHRVHSKLSEAYNLRVSDESSTSSRFGFTYYTNKYSKSEPNTMLPEERAYRLAVTDLFVEKAQAFLQLRAESYQRSGKTARRVACVIVIVGAVLALHQMIANSGQHPTSWLALISAFTRAFTAYGLIVLAAVGFWRYSKSMLDQSERLYERRHALRQGRLFVHLNDGQISVDEMEKAFRWNDSQENAFASINTEASAPWGGVAKELAKSFPEIFRAGLQSVGKGKGDEK